MPFSSLILQKLLYKQEGHILQMFHYMQSVIMLLSTQKKNHVRNLDTSLKMMIMTKIANKLGNTSYV